MGNIWMTTRSGRFLDLNEVRPQDIHLGDIAHALAQICRFNGHTTRFYTVACHSMGMAQYAANKKLPTELVLKCLLHDAKEAYYGDITRPVAEFLRINWDIWNMGPHTVEKAIAKTFFDDPDTVISTPLVKRIDNLFCMVEGYVLVGGQFWEEAKVLGTLTPEAAEDWDHITDIVKSFNNAKDIGDIRCRFYDKVSYYYSLYLREQRLAEYNATHPATEDLHVEDSAESPSPAQG